MKIKYYIFIIFTLTVIHTQECKGALQCLTKGVYTTCEPNQYCASNNSDGTGTETNTDSVFTCKNCDECYPYSPEYNYNVYNKGISHCYFELKELDVENTSEITIAKLSPKYAKKVDYNEGDGYCPATDTYPYNINCVTDYTGTTAENDICLQHYDNSDNTTEIKFDLGFNILNNPIIPGAASEKILTEYCPPRATVETEENKSKYCKAGYVVYDQSDKIYYCKTGGCFDNYEFVSTGLLCNDEEIGKCTPSGTNCQSLDYPGTYGNCEINSATMSDNNQENCILTCNETNDTGTYKKTYKRTQSNNTWEWYLDSQTVTSCKDGYYYANPLCSDLLDGCNGGTISGRIIGWAKYDNGYNYDYTKCTCTTENDEKLYTNGSNDANNITKWIMFVKAPEQIYTIENQDYETCLPVGKGYYSFKSGTIQNKFYDRHIKVPCPLGSTTDGDYANAITDCHLTGDTNFCDKNGENCFTISNLNTNADGNTINLDPNNFGNINWGNAEIEHE